jgi:Secretion system C-terminal sorting domain
MRNRLLFILLFLEAAVLSAQTQITSSDVANVFAAGKGWISTNNDDPQVTMDIGSASSSSQNWTVPNIAWKDTFTVMNISPSGTPYSSDFPTATNCQYFSGMVGGYSGTLYNYFRIQNNGVYSLGNAIQTKIGSKDTVLVNKNETVLFSLPVNYGSSKVISNDTSDFGGGTLYITSKTESVDAFGNMTFPFGTYPALRISDIEVTGLYFNGSPFSSDTTYSFTWIAKDAGTFDISIDQSTGNSGTVTLTDANLSQFNVTEVAVNDGEITTPSSYMLSQNFPNPFNPSTTIRYTIPSVSNGQDNHVTLKVYDVLGNEVTTLVNENKSAGSYEVEFSAKGKNTELPSGIYFYKLTAGSFSQTNKMILLK